MGDVDDSLQDSWKSFGCDTEAGRMLRRLYGSKPKISYPKVRTKPSKKSGPFIPGGGRIKSDARTSNVRKPTHKWCEGIRAMNRGASNRRKPKASDRLDRKLKGARRKQQSLIDADVQEIRNERANFRPRRTKELSSMRNKEKLRQTFQFGGGKALPAVGMPIPLSSSVAPPLSTLTKSSSSKKKRGEAMSDKELFKATLDDIEHRRAYLKRMEALGDYSQHSIIQSEIQRKISEMELIDRLMDKKRAGH